MFFQPNAVFFGCFRFCASYLDVMECLHQLFVPSIPKSIETEFETYSLLNWNVYINDLKFIVGNG